MKTIYTFAIAFLMTVGNAYAQTPLTEAVDFDVTTVHGEEVNLFELLDAGKHVVLDFFFTTCGPCIEAVPTVNETYERYGCNKGDVYFISIDQGDTEAQVLQYEEDYGGLLPSVSGNDGGGNAVNSAYSILAWPTIVLIAPDRTIVSQDIFPATAQNFDIALMTQAGLSENPEACAISGLHDLVEMGTSIKNVLPNPVATSASVEFTVEQAGTIRVDIYNVMGQRVAQLNKQNFVAGAHSLNLPTANLPKGTYTVNLIQDNLTVDAKLLMKN